jgi:type IV pilus assembly protein PilB
MNLPLDLAAPVISRLKVMANMDIIERMHAQDGHINLEISGRIQDLRLASAPTNLGEKVTIRIMDPKNVLTGLHMLGLEDKQLDQINQLIYKPYGMILATGPVGSGKTTTLYSCLNKINVPEKNVMTVEDPVEYRLRGMNQMQVDHKRSYEFADGLKAMLRQDPNVIMVGEVRDAETARIAVRASLTGVLVFSTMHANDGPGTISTLYNHGIPGFLVSSSLIGVIAQRLVRKLCQKCKEAYAPDKELLRQMKVDPDQKVTFYRPVGCADCFNTGYYGRTGVYEIMLVEDELRDLIFRETTKEVIRQVAIDMGMQTMKVSCFNKAIQGVTSAEEYFRVVFI